MAVTTVKKSKRDLIPLSRLLKYVWVDMLLRFPKPQVSLVKAVWFLRSISGDSKASIGQFFLKTVQKHPDNIVLFHEDDKWTYKEFNEWVNRLANYFISLGFKKGDVAVVLLDNRPEVLAISMALSKIGAVASLVNYSQRKKALIHSINLSKPKIIIVGAELIDNFAEIEREADSKSTSIYVVPHLTA
jgi:citronellyl-CoA synthetase